MALYSPNQLPEKKEEKSVYVMNPTMKDFVTTYLDDNNKSQNILIPALETCEFSSKIAPLVINHLANHILNLKGFGYKEDVNLELAKIKEEITIG